MADSFENLKNDQELQAMARTVQAICSEKSLEDILADLYKTRNAELTINRIFDGKFLEGTRLDPLKLSKISFPIHLLDKKNHVTSTKSLEATSIRTKNSDDGLLSTDKAVYTDFAKASYSSSTLKTSKFDDKPGITRLPSDLESNFTLSCSINDAIKQVNEPIKESFNFSMTNFSHTIRDRNERKKNMNRNSLCETIDLTEDLSYGQNSKMVQKSVCELQPKISSYEHQPNLLNQENEKNSIETATDNLNVDGVVTHQKRKRKKETMDQVNVNQKITEEEKLASKKRVKEAEKLEKEIQKEQRKLERKRQKEERMAEKQRVKQIQEVNKIKYDKFELCRELILDVSDNLSETLVDYLRDHPKYKLLTINSFQHEFPNIIKWRRKVTATWDDELCAFMPTPERIQDESFLLIYFDISEFIKHIKDNNLSDNINRLQETFSNKQLIVLIEGYENYCRKRKTQMNRDFTNAVRSGIEEYEVEDMGTTTAPSKKKKKNKAQEPDLEKMEEELLWLQVIAKCLIVHTKDIEDTAEMICILSADIATIPYKNRNCDLNFWVEGQVRVGTDSSDTWLHMLQEIQFVTEPVARGIINVYPTVKSLYNAYKNCLTKEEAENLLTFVEIHNVGFAQRRCINRPLSKRIYEIFMGTDPDYVIS